MAFAFLHIPESCCSAFAIFTPLAKPRNGRKFKLAADNNCIIYGDDDGENEISFHFPTILGLQLPKKL